EQRDRGNDQNDPAAPGTALAATRPATTAWHLVSGAHRRGTLLRLRHKEAAAPRVGRRVAMARGGGLALHAQARERIVLGVRTGRSAVVDDPALSRAVIGRVEQTSVERREHGVSRV